MVKRKRKKLNWFKFGDVQVAYASYNNKTRKGKYAFVKDGKKKGIYKVNPGESPGIHYGLFKGTFKRTKHGINKKKSGKSQAKEYKAKIGRTPSISRLLGKGIVSEEVRDIRNLTQRDIRNKYIALLLKLQRKDALPKELFEILAQKENVKKYKFRLGYTIEFLGDSGESMLDMTTYAKDLDEVQRDIKGRISNGILNYDNVTALKKAGYNIEPKTTLKYDTKLQIKQVRVKIVFTKKR